ncbi:MAG: hypothetical protein H7230_02835 [Candidatus Parcubacteria bacterium]|nr:hypothetical protein [Candidatus Paceibacterota bacterium]
MEIPKTRNSQIGNPSPSRDRLNRARAKLERPSIINLKRAHQLLKVAENPVLDIIDQPIEPGDLQALLKRLYERKVLPNTIITDLSIVQEPNNTSTPGPSIDTTHANTIKFGPRHQGRLEALRQKKSLVS